MRTGRVGAGKLIIGASARYDASMRLREAVDMLANGGFGELGPTTWADLGCGDGTFTLALAELLAAGSVIHAIDRDRSALRSIPRTHGDVRIATYQGDFTKQPWPFDDLDGILMANSLHYVRDQETFIRQCQPRLKRQHRVVIVEYDLNAANPWVPYPVSRSRLTALCEAVGYLSIEFLSSRPSRYRRAALYAALIAP